jgi:hypothetical protein
MYNLKILGKEGGGISWIITESSCFPNKKLTIGNYFNKKEKKQ